MSIDPKKGGQCWTCVYCEDIATQTDNPSGCYYRKCNKSGHDYVDTCEFYCNDYVWDGKYEEYRYPSPSSSSSSSYSSSSSTYSSSSSSGSGKGCLIAIIVAVIIIAIAYYVLYAPSGDSKETTKSQPEATYITAIVNTSHDDLFMRAQPTTDASVLCNIPKGSSVTVLEQDGEWWYVEYNGNTGWCYSAYLALQ